MYLLIRAIHFLHYYLNLGLCGKGEYVDRTNASNPVCVPCPFNAYQDQEEHQDDSCIPCPAGFTTLTEGSENATDCSGDLIK